MSENELFDDCGHPHTGLVEDLESGTLWTVWGINRANRVIIYNGAGEIRVVHAYWLRKVVKPETTNRSY